MTPLPSSRILALSLCSRRCATTRYSSQPRAKSLLSLVCLPVARCSIGITVCVTTLAAWAHGTGSKRSCYRKPSGKPSLVVKAKYAAIGYELGSHEFDPYPISLASHA